MRAFLLLFLLLCSDVLTFVTIACAAGYFWGFFCRFSAADLQEVDTRRRSRRCACLHLATGDAFALIPHPDTDQRSIRARPHNMTAEQWAEGARWLNLYSVRHLFTAEKAKQKSLSDHYLSAKTAGEEKAAEPGD
ncbi:hypothetical protein fugu_007490 [Takifugu bimaculatus]|uniref:Uncharacterized protein n=1 Tax=Takifugu bimaculatus TaxID=433685 RepID=A0A4Z2B8E1_9TELE|nr:hypothetical protein fugu_007490 [Takifugu bimaculatus]